MKKTKGYAVTMNSLNAQFIDSDAYNGHGRFYNDSREVSAAD